MLQILISLVPVFLLIAAGWALERLRFPGGEFWPLAERFIYYFLFPALLLKETSSANLGRYEPATLIATLLAALFTLSILIVALRPLLRINGPTFTSIFQGAIRFNSFVGLAAAQALYGKDGVALFAVAMSVMIPLINVWCIFVLVRYAGATGEAVTWRRQLRLLVSNPLIVACVIGIALNIAGLHIPPVIAPAADLLGKASVALGLMAVGAALDLKVMHQARGPVLLSSALKLVAFPLLMAGYATVFGLEGLGRTVVILWAAMPTSTSAYILARQMGGDGPVMAAGITASHILAALAIPLALALLG